MAIPVGSVYTRRPRAARKCACSTQKITLYWAKRHLSEMYETERNTAETRSPTVGTVDVKVVSSDGLPTIMYGGNKEGRQPSLSTHIFDQRAVTGFCDRIESG